MRFAALSPHHIKQGHFDRHVIPHQVVLIAHLPRLDVLVRQTLHLQEVRKGEGVDGERQTEGLVGEAEGFGLAENGKIDAVERGRERVDGGSSL